MSKPTVRLATPREIARFAHHDHPTFNNRDLDLVKRTLRSDGFLLENVVSFLAHGVLPHGCEHPGKVYGTIIVKDHYSEYDDVEDIVEERQTIEGMVDRYVEFPRPMLVLTYPGAVKMFTGMFEERGCQIRMVYPRS